MLLLMLFVDGKIWEYYLCLVGFLIKIICPFRWWQIQELRKASVDAFCRWQNSGILFFRNTIYAWWILKINDHLVKRKSLIDKQLLIKNYHLAMRIAFTAAR